MSGGVDRTLEIETPLRYKQHVPLRKYEKWRRRKKKGDSVRLEGFEYRHVWRDPKGTFARRPEQGERAKQLRNKGLIK